MSYPTPAPTITAWAIPTDPPVLFADRLRAIDYAVQHRTAAPVKLTTQCAPCAATAAPSCWASAHPPVIRAGAEDHRDHKSHGF